MRRRRKTKIVRNVVVSRMAAEGKAMCKQESGKVLFIDGAVPGDVVDVMITKNKKDYAVSKVIAVKTPSAERIEPFCQHFEWCGGCKWQYLNYDKQLEYKQGIVKEALERVGKLSIPELLPILKADPITYYRNKLEFTFSNKKWLTQSEIENGTKNLNRNALGFHIPGMFDRIVDIEHCYLQGGLSNDIRNAVRDYALENTLTFYDIRQHTGFLRNLIVRTSTLGETMVILSVAEHTEALFPILDFLLGKFPEITSLHYVINPKKNDTLFDLEIVTYHGRGYIYEKLESLTYKISPKSFFQTNSTQAVKLYGVVRDFAQLQGNETVYDLYTGTGSIGLFLAQHCAKVVGIEEIEAAIVDARYNAGLNDIENAFFYAGDVKKMLDQDFVAQHGMPDLLVTDPPRAGMHPDVVKQILNMEVPRIVYVSCNPVTQARDLQLLDSKYTIEKIQPVDMFPHTSHIENVVLLQLT